MAWVEFPPNPPKPGRPCRGEMRGQRSVVREGIGAQGSLFYNGHVCSLRGSSVCNIVPLSDLRPLTSDLS